MNEFVEQPIYAQLSRLGKALANPVRLRLLDLLDTEELSVEQVAELAGLPVKNTSAQLQQLRSAQLVSGRRDGTRMYYRIADPSVSRFLGTYHDFAQQRFADLRAEVEQHLGGPELRPVTAAELDDLRSGEDVLVLDVRPVVDFARAHVPGAVSMPAGEVDGRLAEIPEDRDVVAYCQGPYCVSSPDVVRRLHAAGRSRARTLAGGWTAWVRSGQAREPA